MGVRASYMRACVAYGVVRCGVGYGVAYGVEYGVAYGVVWREAWRRLQSDLRIWLQLRLGNVFALHPTFKLLLS